MKCFNGDQKQLGWLSLSFIVCVESCCNWFNLIKLTTWTDWPDGLVLWSPFSDNCHWSDQLEASILITWSLAANQRPVFKTCDHSQSLIHPNLAPTEEKPILFTVSWKVAIKQRIHKLNRRICFKNSKVYSRKANLIYTQSAMNYTQ